MGRYLTTTGTANVVTRTVSTAYNAVANDRILVPSGGFTITLPLSPLVGDTIQIIDANGVFAASNVTVGRNGSLIQGLAEDLVLDVNGTIVTLFFSGLVYGWIVTGN